MSLIDLAGSERASVAYRAGNDRSKNLQREGGNINKSLLALGNCINALADPRSGHKHIPYRNSKLTRLLRDSLGGKCRTAMIATICQQQSHYDDTQNTLIYASRAKCIKTRPGRNFTDVALQPKNYSIVIENQSKQIVTLQSENEQLRQQLEELKREYLKLQDQPKPVLLNDRPNPNSTFLASDKAPQPNNFLDKSCYAHKLISLYEERSLIKLDILKYESKYRTHELKLTFKQMDEARLSNPHNSHCINGNSTFLSATGIIGTLPTMNNNNGTDSQALRVQLKHYEQERAALVERVENNEKQINAVLSKMSTEFSMRGFGSPNDFDDTIQTFVTEKERTQELEEKKICEQYAYDLAQEAFNRLTSTEELLTEAANVIRHTHAIAKGRGLSEPLEARLSNLLRKLEGKKSVIWKDDKYEMENNKANEPLSTLSSVHDNFCLNFLTPFKNNNTLLSRRLSKNLVRQASYTPDQSNTTFDASQ